MEYSIYIIRCKINNKHYVGQTKKYPIERIIQHVREAMRARGYAFHSAIRRHGEINFELIETKHCPAEEADYWEDFYTTYYNSVQPNGYNILKFGQVSDLKDGWWKGKNRDESTKKKISETKIGTGVGENNPFFGKTHSFSSKNKMSESQKEAWNKKTEEELEVYSEKKSKISREMWENMTEEQKTEVGRKISKSLTGRKLSPEHCKKISENKTGKIQSREIVEKRAASLRGKTHSEETKQKYTQAQRNRVSNETKERIHKCLELLSLRKSVKEVAQIMGYHESTVYAIKNGRTGTSVIGNKKEIKRKATGAKRNSFEAAERKEKIIKLLEKGLSGAEIARQVGCSRNYVSRINKLFVR